MVENGRLEGLITIKDIEKVLEFPHAAKDAHGRLLAAAAIGTSKDTKFVLKISRSWRRCINYRYSTWSL